MPKAKPRKAQSKTAPFTVGLPQVPPLYGMKSPHKFLPFTYAEDRLANPAITGSVPMAASSLGLRAIFRATPRAGSSDGFSIARVVVRRSRSRIFSLMHLRLPFVGPPRCS
jgi:hypothetical protein